jgi:uncharacterized protein (TIGR02996 family)
MGDEDVFVRAIRLTPGDNNLRLAYADWLEERGDPRAELIRIEHELQQFRIGWEHYSSLCLRRTQLRQ